MRLTHANFRSLLAGLTRIGIYLPDAINAHGVITGKSIPDDSVDCGLVLVEHQKPTQRSGCVKGAVASSQHVLNPNLIGSGLTHALQGCATKMLRLAALATVWVLQVSHFVGNNEGEFVVVIVQNTCKLVADFYRSRFVDCEGIPCFSSSWRDVHGECGHVVRLHATLCWILNESFSHAIRSGEQFIRTLLACGWLRGENNQTGDSCEVETHDFLRVLGGSVCHSIPSLAVGQGVA